MELSRKLPVVEIFLGLIRNVGPLRRPAAKPVGKGPTQEVGLPGQRHLSSEMPRLNLTDFTQILSDRFVIDSKRSAVQLLVPDLPAHLDAHREGAAHAILEGRTVKAVR